MQFGIFDHMDNSGLKTSQQYRTRLQLIEAYDAAGFHAYHLAEHHGTPLGLAPAPGIFLAAVAEHSERLRFGPLVYTFSIHHPLRLIEEICMLDQLSGGRFELGVGRGISPIEMGFYDDREDRQAVYEEVCAIVLKGLAGGRLNHAGRFYSFDDVPLEITAVQQPHPPLWYGVAQPDRAVWAAERGMNVVANGPAAAVRAIVEAYHAARARTDHTGTAAPFIGVNRHLVVAETDAAAQDLARPAYRRWFDSLLHLWRANNRPIPLSFPDNFDDADAAGLCLVGSVERVRERIRQMLNETGISYLLCRTAFGDLPLGASLTTVAAMREEIMPAFAAP